MPKMPPIKMNLSRPGLVHSGGNAVRFNLVNGPVRLRTAIASDSTPDMANLLSDPAITAALNGNGASLTVSMLSSYIGGFDNIRKNLASVCDAASGRVFGFVMFDIEPRHRIGSFHIVTRHDAGRGHDSGFRILQLVFKHMFGERGVEKVCIEPLSRNRAVVRQCRMAGLRLEGVLKAHRLDTLTGARLDQHVFGMTKEEYHDWPYRLT